MGRKSYLIQGDGQDCQIHYKVEIFKIDDTIRGNFSPEGSVGNNKNKKEGGAVGQDSGGIESELIFLLKSQEKGNWHGSS
jgi:hypothetical protein